MDSKASKQLSERVMREVTDYLQKYDRDTYARLSREMRDFEGALNQTVTDTVLMYEHNQSLEQSLSHLSPQRRDILQNTFRLQTVGVKFQEQPSGNPLVQLFDAAGAPLQAVASSVFNLHSKQDVSVTTAVQIASVVLEIVLFVLNAIGVDIDVHINRVIGRVREILERMPIIGDLVRAMAGNNDNLPEVVRLFLNVLEHLYKSGALVDIVKYLISEMSKFEMALTIAKVTAYCVITFSTGFAAEAAKIILFLVKVTEFVIKLKNLKKVLSAGTS